MSLIYIIEDEPIMADCIASAIMGVAEDPVEIAVFNDGVSAMATMNEKLPDVVLLDVMLTGPDGFAFLNEMISYPDTAKIPVVLISSLDLSRRNLEHYGVKQVLDKAKMTPEDIYAAIKTALSAPAAAAIATALAEAEGQSTKTSIPELPTPSSLDPAPTPTPQPSNPPIDLNDFKERLAASQDSHAV